MRKDRFYIWLIALWLLLIGGLLSPVWAYPQVNQPDAWRTKPVVSNEVYPTYRFYSTSSFAPVVGPTVYTTAPYDPLQSSTPNKAKKYSPWDEDPEDELTVGTTDDPLPIGSPLSLLAFAVLYIGYILISKMCNFKKNS